MGAKEHDRAKRRQVGEVIALMVSLGLSGCAQESVPADVARVPTESVAADVNGAPTGTDRLVVQLTDVSLHKLPYIVAKEEGLFEKHGLDVDLYITTGAVSNVRGSGVSVPPQFAREGGETDISTGGGAPLMVSRTTNVRERDRVILATTDHVVGWYLFASPSVTSPNQLKGRRLGVSGYGSCTGYMARLFAQRMGWDPDRDVSIMGGALGNRWDLLDSGTVDAVFAADIPYAYAVGRGRKPLVNLGDWNEPIPCSGVSTTRAWLNVPNNRDRAKRFLMAVVEAIALMKKDQSFTLRAMEKWYGISDPKQLEFVGDAVREMPAKPYPAVAGIKRAIEVFDYHEMRQHRPDEFYDDSLMREIDESGFIDQLYK